MAARNLDKAHPGQLHFAFRPSALAWISLLGILSVAPALAVLSFRIHSPMWQCITLSILAVLSALAVVELLVRTVVDLVALSPDGMSLTSFESFKLRRRFIPRAAIAFVAWEKGGGVFVKLLDGQWVKLPGVGRTYQGLTNSVRAWLQRTSGSPGTTSE